MALVAFILVCLASFGALAAPIPTEWQAGAQVVIGELDLATVRAAKPWGNELTQGWNLARAWRKYNNRNFEIILAEYLTFVQVCRQGCAGNTIEGQHYVAMAEQVRALLGAQGGPYSLAANAHAWLAALADPTGAAAKNARLWAKDLDKPASDFATGNIYALAWLLAQAQLTPADQADTFARYAIFVQGKAWIGRRCLDISRVATALDAPPRIDSCN
jgi:hypothetical protein